MSNTSITIRPGVPLWSTGNEQGFLAFQKYLSDLFTYFKMGTPAVIAKITEIGLVKSEWTKVFTHSSAGRINSDFQLDEFQGDKTIGAAFTEFLIRKFGKQVNENLLTILNNNYMATEFQGTCAKNMYLTSYLFYDPDLELESKYYADIFEAFCGGVNMIANNILGIGAGYNLLYQLIVSTFKTVQIDLNKVESNAVDRLQKILDNNKFARIKYIDDGSDRPDLGSVMSMVVNLTNRAIMATGYGSDYRTAQRNAAENAIKWMEDNKVPFTSKKRDMAASAEELAFRNKVDEYNNKLAGTANLKIDKIRAEAENDYKVGKGNNAKTVYQQVVKVSYLDANRNATWTSLSLGKADTVEGARLEAYKLAINKI